VIEEPRRSLLLPWLLGCLFVAGIVHIVSILLMPNFAQKDAYALLGGTTAGVELLPEANARQSIPYQDPTAILGVCRYDLDKGPTRVRSAVNQDVLVTISFHDRTGRIFYSTTDRAALRGRIEILILDAQQLDALEAGDPEDQAPQELRLVAPTRTGFVLIRSLNERPGGKTAALQAAQAVGCSIEQQS
jgi:uncharacterized membrane protein